MAVVENGGQPALPNSFPETEGLQAKPPTETYLGSPPLPTDVPEKKVNHGVTGLGAPKTAHKYLRSLKKGKALEELYLGDGDYAEVDLSQAEQYVRDRYDLGKSPYVVFSAGGSDEILERLVWAMPNPPTTTRILTLGPCFPNLVNFAVRLRGANPENSFLRYGPLDGPKESSLYKPLSERIDPSIKWLKTKKRIGRMKNGEEDRQIVYLNTPNNPTGDILPYEGQREIVRTCAELGIPVIIDGAYGDFVDDKFSPAHFTKEFPNVIYLDSGSKGKGMAKTKVGTGIMSPEEGKKYDSVRRPLDYADPKLDILNYVLEPESLKAFLEPMRKETRKRKEFTMNVAEELRISTLPTHEDTPTLVFDGGYENFVTELSAEYGIVLASGKTYALTHRGINSDRFGRMTVLPIQETREVLRMMRAAINAAA